ncbi:DUF1428 domain-containing protein [Paracoccus liaowanqingii]|uniref:DUF1428 domain-containing protein n=1 Tax=Paracoccus liaowanqingii TaxID=2560053 RepID=A0A4P7HPJ1_9RHOB|nr:DUF1428 domain-containing protein [Paracoccus liaowanqingii]QBX35670.1 DUF1428 domain-containing protein [Paracoccus liaowanqingii]
MTYYTGLLLAVPVANRQTYVDHARQAWPMFQRLGALRMVECWAEDVPHGTQTDFHRATQARDDEAPLFSWIEWPDRATADAAGARMAEGQEPEMALMGEMPFDGMRMMWGGFAPILTVGDSRRGAYVQGFVLAVPADARQAYIEMAQGATRMFADLGATFQTECWGEDVPHGKVTDFHRAVQAKPDEVPVFSWVEWPDRATCDAAAAQMAAGMEGHDFPQMPFDGKRMFWGGFTPVVDLP